MNLKRKSLHSAVRSPLQARLNLKSEHKYRALIKHSGEAVAILSATGKPLYMSPSVEKVLGYNHEEAMQLDFFAIAHVDDVLPLQDVLRRLIANPGIPMKGHTGRFLHKDGSWRWLEATVTNMLNDPSVKGIVDNFRDITESRLAEEKIIHANRLYAFISQINQTIVHVADEQALFAEVCRIAVDIGKFKFAWIGIVNAAIGKIKLVASCGASESDIKLFGDYTYQINGPIVKVLEGLDYYATDIQKDLGILWHQHAVERGFNSGIALPVKKSGKVIGIFNIYFWFLCIRM